MQLPQHEQVSAMNVEHVFQELVDFFSFFKVPVTENGMDVMLLFFFFLFVLFKDRRGRKTRWIVWNSIVRWVQWHVSVCTVFVSHLMLFLIYWCRSEFPKTLLIRYEILFKPIHEVIWITKMPLGNPASTRCKHVQLGRGSLTTPRM